MYYYNNYDVINTWALKITININCLFTPYDLHCHNNHKHLYNIIVNMDLFYHYLETAKEKNQKKASQNLEFNST